jgi:transcriptional regulator with XRE-family HTH domain
MDENDDRANQAPDAGKLVRDWLRQLRHDRGMGQGELAVAMGVYQSRISKWEMGNGEPGIRDLQRIAYAFGKALEIRFEADGSLSRIELVDG